MAKDNEITAADHAYGIGSLRVWGLGLEPRRHVRLRKSHIDPKPLYLDALLKTPHLQNHDLCLELVLTEWNEVYQCSALVYKSW